jgi:hypothetical protein
MCQIEHYLEMPTFLIIGNDAWQRDEQVFLLHVE